MRVLHVWNTAGVGSILAKYQRKLLGWDTWVVMRKAFDPFGVTTYGEAWDCSAEVFTAKALWLARKFDLIHIHSFDRFLKLVKLVYPHKPVVLHYHGTDIRGRWEEKRKYWSRADLVLVSTPDLLDGAPKEAIYLPNPVDTELFKPVGEKTPNTALFIFTREYEKRGYMHLRWAEEKAEEMGLKLTVLDRDKNPIPYTRFPNFLSKFEYFIDREGIPSLSKTALEALACGVKVIRWDGKIIKKLPEKHLPENVIHKLAELYMKINFPT